MHQFRVLCLTAMLLVVIWAGGCSPSDERLVELSQDSVKRQAEQNRAIAAQSQEIAQAAHKLVEADAQARQELIQLQTDLQRESQAERRSLDRQHESLEHERRQIAQQRHRDPIIAAAILNAAVLLACLAPLLLAWFVIHMVRHEPVEAALGDLLVQELVAEQSLLLPANLSGPQLIEHESSPSMRQPRASGP